MENNVVILTQVKKAILKHETEIKKQDKVLKEQENKEKKKTDAKDFREFVITLFVRFNETTKTLNVARGTTVGEFMTQVLKAFNMKKEKKDATLRYEDVSLSEHPRRTLMGFKVENNSTLTLSLPIKGGGVMKPWLKKTEAIQTLTKKASCSVDKLIVCDDEQVLDEDLNKHIRNFIDEKRSTVSAIKLMQEQGTRNIIKLALRNINEDDLNTIKGIIGDRKTEGRKGNTEEKVLRASYLPFPALRDVKNTITSIKSLEGEFGKELPRFYVLEYHSVTLGEAKFDNGKFVGNIDKELQRRENLKEHSNAQNLNEA